GTFFSLKKGSFYEDTVVKLRPSFFLRRAGDLHGADAERRGEDLLPLPSQLLPSLCSQNILSPSPAALTSPPGGVGAAGEGERMFAVARWPSRPQGPAATEPPGGFPRRRDHPDDLLSVPARNRPVTLYCFRPKAIRGSTGGSPPF